MPRVRTFGYALTGSRVKHITESTHLCVLHLQKRNPLRASEASSTPRKNSGVNTISRMIKRAMCPRRCGVRLPLNDKNSPARDCPTFARRRSATHHPRIPDERGTGTVNQDAVSNWRTGLRVCEHQNGGRILEEQIILIAKAKGGKSRYVPILPELAKSCARI